MLKLNLGCGANKLKGWRNFDADVDISKPLPFADECADFILCEHCVEHIEQYQAIGFLKECRRVLNANGVARIIVPSIEQIIERATPDYCRFSMKYRDCGLGPTVRGVADNMIYAFGHKAAWTASLLKALMFYAGFDVVKQCSPRQSEHPELCGIDGHHKIISEAYNDIESVVMEGSA